MSSSFHIVKRTSSLACLLLVTQVALAGDCEPDWQPAFGAPAGAAASSPFGSARIEALLTFDDGSGPALYAAGDFDAMGGTALSGIARWDGTSWSPVGDGALAAVDALAAFDDGSGPALYAAGSFDHVGGQPAANIARWDGESWTPLGSGISGGTVRALAVYDDGGGPSLYAAGSFTHAGGQPASRIARWDGRGWSSLGSGIGGSEVHALAVHDPGTGERLYVGGSFHFAGGNPSSYVAKWNGQWSHGGSGIDAPIHALAVFDAGDGPALHAAGTAGTTGAALWRLGGQVWQPAGGAVLTDGVALGVREGTGGQELLVGGGFHAALGSQGVAVWNGSSWSTLGQGVSGVARAFAEFHESEAATLYVGGSFATAGGQVANDIAGWNGASWSSPGSSGGGLQGPVRSLVVGDVGAGSHLFAGGAFLAIDGEPARRIAGWDGALWTELDGGVDADVLALAIGDLGLGDVLFAGGQFAEAGGVPAAHVACWDGSRWSSLGSGTDAVVRALAVFDDGSGARLYAAGDFVVAGGVTARRVARWDGLAWSGLASGIQDALVPVSARALAVFDDGDGEALFVGGGFNSAGGSVAVNVARWNGSAWSALTNGVNQRVDTLVVFDDGLGPALYAGGAFTKASGVDARRVARWDGRQWSGVGVGTDDDVAVLASFDDGRGPALFAGGLFQEAGGVEAQRVARWDGSSWAPLGPGITAAAPSAPVEALAALDDGSGSRLFVGGDFVGSAAGDAHLASWGGCSADTPWSDLGGGTTGIAGVPSLELTGSLEPGSLLSLAVTNGAPSALGLLFVSIGSTTPAPFLGGTLHAVPFAQLVVIFTDPLGELHAAVPFPGAPSGLGLWFQLAVQDASVPVHGGSLSHGVMGVVP